MSAAIIVGASAAVLGAGTAIYGAQQNKKAIAAANEANAKNVADTNAANYALWKESRGIAADGSAVNTKLPQWMSVRTGGPTTVKRVLTKVGASQANPNPYLGVSASQTTPYSFIQPKAASTVPSGSATAKASTINAINATRLF